MKIRPVLMHRYLLLLLLAFAACRPAATEDTPLPTEICVRTQHHGVPVPNSMVYVKFNTDSFPGYNRPSAYFDDSVRTDADARGCIAAVPEGHHWLIAISHDDNYFPPIVYGSLPVNISLNGRPKIDTILYVSEQH